ncbi:Rieske 2Fe-2S domain-containing protein, partial [Candidatus Macondimonas diazotrophica]|nr:Rieske 2Fe-2S domain-containing protein [Candidatus Macondimonas diazotrophica]
MAQNGSANGQFIIDDKDAGVFKVSRRAFVDDGILAAEKRKVFDRCWLYVGHESEIAKNGDFVTRNIAGRNLIFNRDRGGKVNVFYNTCTHRGAFVCREDQGNSRRFQCFYHGWVFSDEGDLVEVPGRDSYCAHFNEDGSSNLARVERLDAYRGLYFINFGDEPTSLEDYLGGAREYIDLVLDQAETGMEIVGGTQQYGVNANWKLMTENSIDGYHAATTHATYMDYLVNAGAIAQGGMGGGGGRQLG